MPAPRACVAALAAAAAALPMHPVGGRPPTINRAAETQQQQSSAAAAPPDAEVTLLFGVVVGNQLRASREFLGIPYAPAPVRFAPPSAWTAMYAGGRLEAKRYTPHCAQPNYPVHARFSEDCLHLNVYTPLGRSGHGAGWPVMLWIHGGSQIVGSAMEPSYNGSALAARRGVVVVAVNYRLAAFGFAPTLAPGGGAVANLGLRDQREAMRWVRRHVGAFGGDAARVTLFGESAGGQSVAMHVVSRGSAGLFRAAISESADMFSFQSLAGALNHTATMAARLGCAGAGDLACLRAASAAEVNAAYSTMDEVVVDGDVLAAPPLDLIRRGDFNRVPYTLGTNADEANAFIFPPFANSTPATAADARCAAAGALGAAAPGVLDLYPPVEGADNRLALAALTGDLWFQCGNREIALALAAAGQPPWVYSFRRQAKCVYEEQYGWTDRLLGAMHGTEVVFVFNNIEYLASPAADAPCVFPGRCRTSCVPAAADLALSDRVSQLWAGFARAGRMDAAWPRFRADAQHAAVLDIGAARRLGTETGYRRGQCDALAAAGVDARAASTLDLPGALLRCQQRAPPPLRSRAERL